MTRAERRRRGENQPFSHRYRVAHRATDPRRRSFVVRSLQIRVVGRGCGGFEVDPNRRTTFWANQGWSLYRIDRDRGEQRDLAGAEGRRLERMTAEWNRLTEQFRLDAGGD